MNAEVCPECQVGILHHSMVCAMPCVWILALFVELYGKNSKTHFGARRTTVGPVFQELIDLTCEI
jgi:hypothetical protein